ncbi:DNA polymerase III subunit delta [Shewanella waksmanii]|uniref:DNA polymerase III subunit delta n=1 Tax=Shewanella waksmanii TaxID=213783 RepID=UPI003734D703
MRVYPDQLTKHLNQLKPVYLIFGDDPWLTDQCRRQILDTARHQGFEENIQLYQESGFDWSTLVDEWQSMSLFASRRIIELTLPQAKPGADGSKTFSQLLSTNNPDTILLLKGPKLAAEQTKSKWFKALDSDGLYIPCATPEGPQFQRWLDGRINHYQLRLSQDARTMLTALYEGNLLAADQALQLLCLLSPNDVVDTEQLTAYFEDQSRFSVFQLADTLLNNQQDKAQHILSQLQAEGVAMPILLWSLFKELNCLLTLKSAQQRGEQLHGLWQKMRIWDKRKNLYQGALQRLELKHIEHMLAVTSTIERKLKSQGQEDWVAMSHLCLLFDANAHQALAHIEVD